MPPLQPKLCCLNVMATRISFVGRRFGRWFIFDEAPPKISGSQQKTCSWGRCDCGTEKILCNGDLTSGMSQSCGCLKREVTIKRNTTHGLSKTRTYSIWKGMFKRCTNPNCKQFEDWGGRGIKVCERWEVYENFLADMGECPARLTIDRYPDPNGNYEPSNCRWATYKQQARNTKRNRIFTVKETTGCLAELCEIFNKKYDTIRRRLNCGWPPELAFFAPTNSTLESLLKITAEDKDRTPSART